MKEVLHAALFFLEFFVFVDDLNLTKMRCGKKIFDFVMFFSDISHQANNLRQNLIRSKISRSS